MNWIYIREAMDLYYQTANDQYIAHIGEALRIGPAANVFLFDGIGLAAKDVHPISPDFCVFV